MAAKLKSISKRIPWSLAFKATLLAAAWLILPYWLFTLLAVGLYLVPLFRPLEVALPFVIILGFAAGLEQGPWAAIFIGLTFFLAVGIKDLVLINRPAAYELLVLVLSFGLFLDFFHRFPGIASQASASIAALLGLLVFLLVRGLGRYVLVAADLPEKRVETGLLAGILAILIWQFAWGLTFLPLNFFYQTAIIFLFMVVSLEVGLSHLGGRLTRNSILVNFSVFLIFVSVILAATDWRV